jgi:hypothetical protein
MAYGEKFGSVMRATRLEGLGGDAGGYPTAFPLRRRRLRV